MAISQAALSQVAISQKYLSQFVQGASFEVPRENLQVWFRADMEDYAEAAAVDNWHDQSGGAHDATQTIAASRPTFKENIINGSPIIRLDGTSDYMNIIKSWQDAITVYVVLSRGALGAEHYIISNGNHRGVGGGLTLRFRSTNTVRFWNGYANFVDSTIMPSVNTPIQITALSDTYNRIFINGVSDGTTIRSVFVRNEKLITRIGHSELFDGYYNGDFAEILIYGTSHSDTIREGIEGYLKTKYAI